MIHTLEVDQLVQGKMLDVDQSSTCSRPRCSGFVRDWLDSDCETSETKQIPLPLVSPVTPPIANSCQKASKYNHASRIKFCSSTGPWRSARPHWRQPSPTVPNPCHRQCPIVTSSPSVGPATTVNKAASHHRPGTRCTSFAAPRSP